MADATTENRTDLTPLPALVGRSAFGGVLMGLANLVPGISGGTMLLASGVYKNFIEGIAEVTTLRFRRRSLAVLFAVVIAAVAAIGLLAGVVKDLVVDHRWIMYSIFIGLTLGGVPIVTGLIARWSPQVIGSALMGFLVMALLAWVQASDTSGGTREQTFAGLLVAGTAAAAAMILPGVSGGYLLLVLGAYVPLLAGIEAFVDAARVGDLAAARTPFVGVILPVGLGVVIGVVGVSNLLRFLMIRFDQPTTGFLLGLLVGAVIGIWPFQYGVAPEPGATFRNQTVALDDSGALVLLPTGRALEADQFPIELFTPSAVQVASAVALIAAGFAVTWLLSRLDGKKEAARSGTGVA